MRRKFDFSVGEYYHIYNRGTDKRVVFRNSHDYNRFISLLYLCNSTKSVNMEELKREHLRKGLSFTDFFDYKVEETLVDIGVYCLMPNHFHLLIKEKTENGISLFMKKLLTAYSMYFNKCNKRSGRLFEGPFLATHANTDNYLKYLFSYIHLNPVKLIDPLWKEVGIKDLIKANKYISKYIYSSYLDYTGIERREHKIINRTAFPEYFLDSQDFDKFINEWLLCKGQSFTESTVS